MLTAYNGEHVQYDGHVSRQQAYDNVNHNKPMLQWLQIHSRFGEVFVKVLRIRINAGSNTSRDKESLENHLLNGLDHARNVFLSTIKAVPSL